MGFFKEFKEFAVKGNVMDMAVGVIIGGAFGKIVTSLVNDILMPPIGALLGNVNFRDLKVDISKVRDVVTEVNATVVEKVTDGVDAVADAAADVVAEGTDVAINSAEVVEELVAAPAQEPIYWCYGAFIQECIDFIILAFCVFLMVRLMNRLNRKPAPEPAAPAPEPEPTAEEKLLTEIRDLLKKEK